MDKTIHLLSSGIDSPVAAYFLIKNGIEPIFLFFDAIPFNTEKTRNVAILLARRIATIANKTLKMYICQHGPLIQHFQELASPKELKYTCIFCKRIYYSIAKI
ncbi:MAG: hypothetical protein ACTSRA_17005, partial [Promethearchaeota archaeon]